MADTEKTPDGWDPMERVAMGAKVDQARQEYVEMVDTLIEVTRRKVTLGDPLSFPSVAMTVAKSLESLTGGDQEDMFWFAVNMLAEATLRLVRQQDTVQN